MYNHAIILFDKFSNFIGNLAFENIKYKHGLLIFKQLKLNFFLFLPGFSSQTLTIHRTAGEGRGPSFIPLYHFHPLTNIATFIFFSQHIEKALSGYFASWKPLTAFASTKFWFVFGKKRSTEPLYESWKPSFRLTKIARKVLTWCFDKLKSISFPRENLKNNL